MRVSRRLKLRQVQSRASVQARAKKSAVGRLSALREALQESVPDEHWHATEAQELPLKLAGLQEQWQQQEADAAAKSKHKARDTERPGVRRVKGAIEYDFSKMREEDIDDSSDDDTPDLHHARPSVASEVRYFDSASISVRAGNGGTGCCAFLREKFMPHGGPCGGNGGHGGSVWAIADENMHSLTPFRGRVHWKADHGGSGGGKSKHGANAADLFIKLPPGTIVRKKEDVDEGLADSQPPIAELVKHGDKALILQGGRGGRGNEAFKTGRNNAPTIAEDGEQGPEEWLTLELKLMADVGIIGVPNSGKSTLLRVLSNAKPKIADYAFTTLVPNLGVCELDFETTVFADVPGLIEGAHNGTGLGVEFLRHVSRAHTLVHVLDGTARDVLYDYRAIRLELQLFGGGLSDKPQVIAYNKVDVPDSGDYVAEVRTLLHTECGVAPESVVPISAATGEGVLELVRKVRHMLGALPQQVPRLSTNAINQQVKAQKPGFAEEVSDYTVDCDLGAERVWYVSGPALERFAQMTNFMYWEATLRFQRVLQAVGLWADLERRGVREGDTVVIGGTEFLWRDDRSEARMYEGWQQTQGGAGPGKGSKRWPHMTV